MVEKKVEGNVVPITPLFEEVFDDDEQMKENVVSKAVKKIVSKHDDNDDAEGTVKQAGKRKGV